MRRGRILGGLLVIVVSAAATGWLFVSSGERTAVLVVRRDVPVGTVLSAGDVASTRVAADRTVATIAAAQRRSVVGRVAATDLRAGTLVAPSQLTTAWSPGQGQQIVPVGWKASQLPTGGLHPGDQVLVVPTPGTGGQDAAAAGPDAAAPLTRETPAVVDRVSTPGTDGVVVVNLLVDASSGPQIAKQASTGRLALVVTTRRP